MSAAAQPPLRIVSLLASATELVAALGLGDRLVGRSHECDHPAWVKKLPVLSHPAFDIDGTSAEIDARVRARLHAGLPLYQVDEDRLAALGPDVILTQTHCEVCATTDNLLRNPQTGSEPPAMGSTQQSWAESRAIDLEHGVGSRLERHQVVALSTGTIAGILDGFARVAAVLGAAETGAALVAGLQARLDAVAAKTRGRPRPRVACLEWIAPLFAMGNWGPEIVDVAGGDCVFGTPGVHSTTLPLEALTDADPDVVVVAPCGFDLPRTLRELPALTELPGWRALRAVREGRSFAADGNFYFNRSGPMLFDTPALLAEMLHPDAFPPAHQGTLWRRLGG